MVTSPHSEQATYPGIVSQYDQTVYLFYLVFLREIENMTFGGAEFVGRFRYILHKILT